MRKLIWTFIAATGLSFVGAGVGAAHRVRGETLSLSQTKGRFGDEPFDAEKFRAGDEAARARMAANLLRAKAQFNGKSNAEIRDLLGYPTGHYITGLFPTYMIRTAKDQSESSWQIVFLIDAQQKVYDVVVHKNCCYE